MNPDPTPPAAKETPTLQTYKTRERDAFRALFTELTYLAAATPEVMVAQQQWADAYCDLKVYLLRGLV